MSVQARVVGVGEAVDAPHKPVQVADKSGCAWWGRGAGTAVPAVSSTSLQAATPPPAAPPPAIPLCGEGTQSPSLLAPDALPPTSTGSEKRKAHRRHHSIMSPLQQALAIIEEMVAESPSPRTLAQLHALQAILTSRTDLNEPDFQNFESTNGHERSHARPHRAAPSGHRPPHHAAGTPGPASDGPYLASHGGGASGHLQATPSHGGESTAGASFDRVGGTPTLGSSKYGPTPGSGHHDVPPVLEVPLYAPPTSGTGNASLLARLCLCRASPVGTPLTCAATLGHTQTAPSSGRTSASSAAAAGAAATGAGRANGANGAASGAGRGNAEGRVLHGGALDFASVPLPSAREGRTASLHSIIHSRASASGGGGVGGGVVHTSSTLRVGSAIGVASWLPEDVAGAHSDELNEPVLTADYIETERSAASSPSNSPTPGDSSHLNHHHRDQRGRDGDAQYEAGGGGNARPTVLSSRSDGGDGGVVLDSVTRKWLASELQTRRAQFGKNTPLAHTLAGLDSFIIRDGKFNGKTSFRVDGGDASPVASGLPVAVAPGGGASASGRESSFVDAHSVVTSDRGSSSTAVAASLTGSGAIGGSSYTGANGGGGGASDGGGGVQQQQQLQQRGRTLAVDAGGCAPPLLSPLGTSSPLAAIPEHGQGSSRHAVSTSDGLPSDAVLAQLLPGAVYFPTPEDGSSALHASGNVLASGSASSCGGGLVHSATNHARTFSGASAASGGAAAFRTHHPSEGGRQAPTVQATGSGGPSGWLAVGRPSGSDHTPLTSRSFPAEPASARSSSSLLSAHNGGGGGRRDYHDGGGGGGANGTPSGGGGGVVARAGSQRTFMSASGTRDFGAALTGSGSFGSGSLMHGTPLSHSHSLSHSHAASLRSGGGGPNSSPSGGGSGTGSGGGGGAGAIPAPLVPTALPLEQPIPEGDEDAIEQADSLPVGFLPPAAFQPGHPPAHAAYRRNSDYGLELYVVGGRGYGQLTESSEAGAHLMDRRVGGVLRRADRSRRHSYHGQSLQRSRFGSMEGPSQAAKLRFVERSATIDSSLRPLSSGSLVSAATPTLSPTATGSGRREGVRRRRASVGTCSTQSSAHHHTGDTATAGPGGETSSPLASPAPTTAAVAAIDVAGTSGASGVGADKFLLPTASPASGAPTPTRAVPAGLPPATPGDGPGDAFYVNPQSVAHISSLSEQAAGSREYARARMEAIQKLRISSKRFGKSMEEGFGVMRVGSGRLPTSNTNGSLPEDTAVVGSGVGITTPKRANFGPVSGSFGAVATAVSPRAVGLVGGSSKQLDGSSGGVGTTTYTPTRSSIRLAGHVSVPRSSAEDAEDRDRDGGASEGKLSGRLSGRTTSHGSLLSSAAEPKQHTVLQRRAASQASLLHSSHLMGGRGGLSSRGQSSVGTRGTSPAVSEDEGGAMPIVERLRIVTQWEFDVFDFATRCDNRPLAFISFELFSRFQLFDSLRIPESTFTALVNRVERDYCYDPWRANPYHTNVHAADVVQAVGHFLIVPRIAQMMDQFNAFSIITAAIVHDFRHPGVNNTFLTKTGDPIAVRYNDESVLENFHAAEGFAVMAHPRYDLMAGFSREHRSSCRFSIIKSILATDLAQGQKYVNAFKARSGVATLGETDEDKLLVMQMMIKCADVSHPARQWKVHERWSTLVTEEFYRQGDRERDLALPISPLCDRHDHNLPKSQLGFINFVVLGAFRSFSDFCGVSIWIDQLRANETRWKALAAAGSTTSIMPEEETSASAVSVTASVNTSGSQAVSTTSTTGAAPSRRASYAARAGAQAVSMKQLSSHNPPSPALSAASSGTEFSPAAKVAHSTDDIIFYSRGAGGAMLPAHAQVSS